MPYEAVRAYLHARLGQNKEYTNMQMYGALKKILGERAEGKRFPDRPERKREHCSCFNGVREKEAAGMENEMDLSIARFIREQREREEQEERERLRKQYDPRERITYTLRR